MSMEFLSIFLCLPQFLLLVSQFSVHSSFAFLVTFIPKYFILFDAIVTNGTVFLISLSDSLLLVYRNAIDFCISILFPPTSLNSFISSSSFLLESLGFSLCSIMSSATGNSFTSFFPIWIPFISFSCVIAVARTSNTMLNKNGESESTCLIPDLRGKAFSFSPLRMNLAVGLVYNGFYYIEVHSFYAHLLRDFFIINEC